MARSDLFPGLLLLVFGALVLWRASTFPAMAGLPYGPGLFPSIAAVGMVVCGVLLVLSALLGRGRTASGVPAASCLYGGAAARVVALLATVAGYALLLDPLGFHVASLLAITVTALLFGLGLWRALLLALVLTVGVHLVFYSLMRVPLPWGVLIPLAW